jgi:hypothetical protein
LTKVSNRIRRETIFLVQLVAVGLNRVNKKCGGFFFYNRDGLKVLHEKLEWNVKLLSSHFHFNNNLLVIAHLNTYVSQLHFVETWPCLKFEMSFVSSQGVDLQLVQINFWYFRVGAV